MSKSYVITINEKTKDELFEYIENNNGNIVDRDLVCLKGEKYRGGCQYRQCSNCDDILSIEKFRAGASGSPMSKCIKCQREYQNNYNRKKSEMYKKMKIDNLVNEINNDLCDINDTQSSTESNKEEIQ